MIPALFTSSSALAASQSMLSVVGNNLANTNTAGFKTQSLLFSNQFSQILSDASQPTQSSGGKNPILVGTGVQVASTDTNLSQGTFQSTGNPLDLAIQKGGYFVLKDGSSTLYSRAGSFAVSSNGFLIDPATGALVQRVGTVGEGTATTPSFQVPGDNSIAIPSGLTIPGSATQNINFNGNLNANAVGPVAQVLTTAQAITVGGHPAKTSTSLDALDQTVLTTNSPNGYQVGDVVSITGTRVDGSPVNVTYKPTGTPSSDTVAALLNTINEAFESGTASTGATASLNSSGQIVLTANQPGPSGLSLTISSSSPNPSGTTTQFSNFVQTAVGKAGDTATSVIQVFDAQGSPHNVTFSFEKVAANRWNVTASMNASEGSITGYGLDNTVAGITFNPNGTLQSIVGGNSSEELLTQSPMTVNGVAAQLSTPIQSLDQHTGNSYSANDKIQITGTDYNGKTIVPQSVPTTINGNPATVGDLINAINASFGGAVATLDPSGNIVLTATRSGQASLSLNIADSTGNVVGALTTFSPFIQAAPGTNGDSNITLQINNLAGFGKSQTISLAMGTPNSTQGVTQTGSSASVAASSQDGYAQGTLEATSVSANGVVTGQFTNGQTLSIAQIGLATFTNPAGLQNAGNNYFTSSTASGTPNVTSPGSNGAGTLQSGGLEGSNVNVANEFTSLIAAQQAYEVNAKAFSVANQLMDATNNLIR